MSAGSTLDEQLVLSRSSVLAFSHSQDPEQTRGPRSLFRPFNVAQPAAVPPVSGTAELTRYRALPVVSSCECTGIIRCSLGFPGNMTKGCVESLTSTSRG